MLPGVAVGFGLATEAALPPLWHLAAWAHAWPISEALDGTSGGRLGAWTLGAGPLHRACLARTPGLLRMCGRLGRGGLLQRGGPQRVVYEVAPVPAGRGFAWAFACSSPGPMFARLEVGVGLPITRDSYQFTGADGVAASRLPDGRGRRAGPIRGRVSSALRSLSVVNLPAGGHCFDETWGRARPAKICGWASSALAHPSATIDGGHSRVLTRRPSSEFRRIFDSHAPVVSPDAPLSRRTRVRADGRRAGSVSGRQPPLPRVRGALFAVDLDPPDLSARGALDPAATRPPS